ncbi:phosphotransferase family protein [Nocardioides sp. DS6]|uniref:Phosphotransferase family protein n=1 Tax=Nocardioides eburneus TaxID=3231482 RepID=A0ABV3T0C7_9ACTN
MIAQEATESLPGLDLARLHPWLVEHLPEVRAASPAGLTARHIAGGKSNLTYEVGDGTGTWIVRRPPLGHVLATAHDMAREYTVMTALRDTAVPVPRTFALCRDEEVLGAPFYVMERVVGRPYRHASELEPLGPARTRGLCEQLVDVLAALHAVDPAEVGLGDFGRPEGFLSRQVGRWKKQLDASHTRDLPAAEELHRRLAAAVTTVEEVGSVPGIVHGDYRLDNVLTDTDTDTDDGEDRIRAVVDWEMATLGDPVTDLAVLITYQRMADWAADGTVTDVSRAPGWLSEDELLGRYDAASHRDLTHFGFYLGLAAFKLAAILEGIHYRYLQGQTVGPGFDTVGDAIHPLLDAGLTALGERA